MWAATWQLYAGQQTTCYVAAHVHTPALTWAILSQSATGLREYLSVYGGQPTQQVNASLHRHLTQLYHNHLR